jgi:hypothetical protein
MYLLSDISGSHGDELEDDFLLVVVPCSHLVADRRFRRTHWIHHQGDEALNMETVSISETSVSLYYKTRHSIQVIFILSYSCDICVW